MAPICYSNQLEALVQGLEESFTGTEEALSSLSPGSLAKVHAEKERRQNLIRKISHALASSSSNNKSDWEGSTEDSVASGRSMADANIADCEGSVEWKRHTLIRLRKFLKKKYRQKKSG